jgi:hypothetical protein
VPGIIDGQSWLNQRRTFLLAELAKEPSDELRAVLETELASLEAELTAAKHHRWRRWLLPGSRSPM